jgi:hypothetical protein
MCELPSFTTVKPFGTRREDALIGILGFAEFSDCWDSCFPSMTLQPLGSGHSDALVGTLGFAKSSDCPIVFG